MGLDKLYNHVIKKEAEKQMPKGKPLSNKEKSALRRNELNEIAQAISALTGVKNIRGEPISTWRELETTLKRKYANGEEIHLLWKPARGTLRPA